MPFGLILHWPFEFRPFVINPFSLITLQPVSGQIFKVEKLFERYIHVYQMYQKIFLNGATPRAHGPFFDFANFSEKNNFLTIKPILNLIMT